MADRWLEIGRTEADFDESENAELGS